jgi:CDP-diacylglycerol--glycerol-3-phosphate 3-phosphatidyltransferase
MLAAFLMMMKIPALHVPGWTIVVILTREFMVTGARALAASEGTVIAAIASGKTKTVLQMVYVFVFLFFAFIFQLWDTYPVTGSWLPGDVAIYKRVIGMASMASITLVAAYTVYSGVEFARINWRKLGLDNI